MAEVDVAAIIQAALAGGAGGAGLGTVYLGENTQEIIPPASIAVPGAKPQKVTMPKTLTIQQANAMYLTDPKLQANWRKTMQKNGLETGNPLLERQAWETAVAGASDWYSTSNGTAKVTPEQYLTWWAGGRKPKADLSRSIYQYSPEQIDADINEVAQKVLGRAIVDADKSADWYQDLTKGLNKMIAGGTTTTTKLVKNKKTGKLEQVTTQTPEFTKEKAAQTIEAAVSEADPMSLERKQNLDFANWAFEKMGGRG